MPGEVLAVDPAGGSSTVTTSPVITSSIATTSPLLTATTSPRRHIIHGEASTARGLMRRSPWTRQPAAARPHSRRLRRPWPPAQSDWELGSGSRAPRHACARACMCVWRHSAPPAPLRTFVCVCVCVCVWRHSARGRRATLACLALRALAG